MKIRVNREICSLDQDLFAGAIHEVIKNLEKLEKEHSGKGMSNFRIKINQYYDDGISFSLHGERLETDVEYKSRLKRIETKKEEDKKRLEDKKARLKEAKELGLL